jgi:hypothetical protein
MLHAQQCNWWATSIKLFYGDDDEGAAAPAGITRLGGVEPMGDIAAAGTGPLDAGEGDLRETAVTADVTLPTGGCCGCILYKSPDPGMDARWLGPAGGGPLSVVTLGGPDVTKPIIEPGSMPGDEDCTGSLV